jgi:nitrous oxidase accessory protein NosD
MAALPAAALAGLLVALAAATAAATTESSDGKRLGPAADPGILVVVFFCFVSNLSCRCD